MPTPDKALNLLVVEDDASLRDALLITLEAGGFRVTGADGGPAALEVLANPGKTGGVHMVVSDLRMSPMDGLTLLGEIRQRHPGLPVMLMTAFGDVDKRWRRCAAGRAISCSSPSRLPP
jgi:two-component system response regulator FlrC